MNRSTVAVLGAGLQGACAALALADRGFRVHLLDQAPEPMLRASLRNEGKIHLGFIYANDPSFRSAELMLEAGLAFGPLIDGWLPEAIDWRRIRSRRFLYLVMRDSMVAVPDLRRHYERLAERLDARRREAGPYLGVEIERLWRETDRPNFVAPEAVATAIETAEAAIDLTAFRGHVVAALTACEHIVWHPHRRIEAVTRSPSGFRVEGAGAPGRGGWRLEADAVVNCLWEGRLEIDREMGLLPERPWVYRLKYRVLAELPQRLRNLPALTMTLGPYGDVVPMRRSSYLSWYPSCRRGWSSAYRCPDEWDEACSGSVGRELRSSLSGEVYEALDHIVPGIGCSQTTAVDAGVVFSWGETDIDHIDSGLHERFAVGVRGEDGYYSIDTGKLTCAPLFAHQLAARLRA